MKTVLGVLNCICLTFIASVSGRVPVSPTRFRNRGYPEYNMHHPPVLTRPPIPATKPMPRVTTLPPTPPTTPEAPEPGEGPTTIASAGWGSNYNMYGGNNFDYGYNSANSNYDYFGIYGGAAGGASAAVASAEVEYGTRTTVAPRSYRNRGPPTRLKSGRRHPVATLAPTTTIAPTTEPADDDLLAAFSSFGSSAGNGPGAGGYCYCSPLSSCPRDSFPRGGGCTNFLSYFLNIQYIRCCYRPSMARRMGL